MEMKLMIWTFSLENIIKNYHTKYSYKNFDPSEIRTRDLRLRRAAPYPLGQRTLDASRYCVQLVTAALAAMEWKISTEAGSFLPGNKNAFEIHLRYPDQITGSRVMRVDLTEVGIRGTPTSSARTPRDVHVSFTREDARIISPASIIPSPSAASKHLRSLGRRARLVHTRKKRIVTLLL